MQRKPAPKSLGVMEKRVPKSEKYAHVESRLNTGLTVNKVKVLTARECSKRRDEIFYRISKNQLYELYNEYEADERETIADSQFGGHSGPRIVTYSESSSPDYEKPYLIFDVREEPDYHDCHLLQARSFPFALLRRDQMHPDIYKFRNKEESLIIVYCDDERISREFAKTLVDRGIDNMFVLTGGIKDFVSSYPSFAEGNITDLVPPMKGFPKKSGGLGAIQEDRQSVISSRSGTSSSSLSHASVMKHSSGMSSSAGNSRLRDRDDASSMSGMSAVSNKSVAESVIERSISRKGRF